MTAVLDESGPDTTTPIDAASPIPASWSARAGAFAIDVILPLGVMAVALALMPAAQKSRWLFWVCIATVAAVVLAMAVNRLLLPAITGWSLGRSLFGITVVDRTGSAVSPWRLALRDMAHLLDTLAVFVGWLWPLWDPRGRTFADLLTKTEVRRVTEETPDRRRLAGAVLAGAALVALVIAGLGYQFVYRHQVAVDRTRAQIADQGPKIVVEMLSYGVATLNDDFSHARSLAADSYRPALVAQQEAVRKAGPVDNDYWATDSAVLSASTDQAVMLVLLQGQRGAAPKQRLITATVRVDFQKSAAGQWQVSNLTVLARPNTNKQGQ